jgi:hypothetical protein
MIPATPPALSLRDIQKQVATLQVAERFFDSVVLFALFESGVFRELALNLIRRVATPHGRNYAIVETSEWLAAAGFLDVKHVWFSTWNVNRCLIGYRPVDTTPTEGES